MDAKHVTVPQAGDATVAVSPELLASQRMVALHDGFREAPTMHSVGAPPASVGCKSSSSRSSNGSREKWRVFYCTRGRQLQSWTEYASDPSNAAIERHLPLWFGSNHR